MSTQTKDWRIWNKGKASDAMTAGEVWNMMKAGEISDQTLVTRDHVAHGWAPLSDYLETLQWLAQEERRQSAPPPTAMSTDVAGPDLTAAQWVGIVALIIAFGIGVIGLGMDVTVTAESGRSINNIGLMSERLVMIIMAGFAALIGVIMLLLGGKK